MIKNLNKNLNGEYSPYVFDHYKHSVTDALGTSTKRVIKKTVEATGDLKLMIKLRKSPKLCNRIIRKQ